jgi:alpha-tubulin suppressor-like RCC1 family protein
VATVSDTGLVTAVGDGEATVTATSAADPTKTDDCLVTVTTPVASVTIDPTELTLKPGDTETLAATVLPPTASNPAVVWKSSAEGVATVSGNGPMATVTAVAAGSATITVASVENPLATATCDVAVAVVIPTVPLAGGASHVLGVKAGGSLWAWGFDGYGQLGDGGSDTQRAPVQVGGVAGGWAAVSANSYYTMAIRTDGSLYAWGWNQYGQLGDGTNTDQPLPVLVGMDADWVSVSAGYGHALAVKADGSLWAWGSNDSGQLGLGNTQNQNVPTKVDAADDWAAVAAGGSYSLAIKKDGSLWAWGKNDLGQLGLGDNTNKNVPIKLDGENEWSDVSASYEYALAIKKDGSLWAGGINDYYQLGLGNTVNRNTPQPVGGTNDWALVATGRYHALAVKKNGDLWAWGRNLYGQLGFGDYGSTTSRTVPTRIVTDSGWVAVAAGGYSNRSMGIKEDGSLWTWGLNQYGQLGDGTNANRYVPTKIGDGWLVPAE